MTGTEMIIIGFIAYAIIIGTWLYYAERAYQDEEMED